MLCWHCLVALFYFDWALNCQTAHHRMPFAGAIQVGCNGFSVPFELENGVMTLTQELLMFVGMVSN